MLELFKKYRELGKEAEAMISIRNEFNNHHSNPEVFYTYVDYLILNAEQYAESYSESQSYLEQAKLAVSIFSENAALNEELVVKIIEYKNRICETNKSLYAVYYNHQKELAKETIKKNDILMNTALTILDQLNSASNRADFQKELLKIQDIDDQIDKEMLVDNQKIKYGELTKRCSDIVTQKNKQFMYIDNVSYNESAIDAYEKVYQIFKNGTKFENHMEIMLNFFSFDQSRLFNETLVYYNHVYSYILSKLNDDEKFNLTKLAVKSRKIVK